MFNIFKHDKHGIWLKNKYNDVILIERDFLDYDRDFLIMYLVMEGINKLTAEQVTNTIEEYQRSIYSI